MTDEREVVAGFVNLATILEEILAELKRANATERVGAVSSVEIHDLAPTKDRPSAAPQVSVKRYTGSEPEVEQAIADHCLAKQLAEFAWKHDWQVTLEELQRV